MTLTEKTRPLRSALAGLASAVTALALLVLLSPAPAHAA